MMDGLRKAGQSWLGKIVVGILFGFLILSFAVWGIGDIFRSGFGLNSVAKVGTGDIGIETMRRAYLNDLQQLQQQTRQNITNAQAREIGLDRNALQRLIAESVLDQETRRLGLQYTAEQVARGIVDMQAFKDSAGKFDRNRFETVLRNEGQSETSFMQSQRQITMRQHLVDGLAGSAAAPNVLLDALHRFRNEERRLDYVIVPEAKAGEVPAADEAALKAYYEQRRALYRTPEYRQARLLSVLPQQFAGNIEVTEADLQTAYDLQVRSGRLGSLEKRTLQQLVFPNEAEAAAALETLKGGVSFEDMAKQRGVKDAELALGTLTRFEIGDRAIAEAAFAADEGAVAGPVKGALVIALIRVVKVEAGTVPGLDWERERLKPLVLAQKISSDSGVRRAVNDLHDKVEAIRSDGKSLEEAAKLLNLSVQPIEAIDRNGLDRNAVPVTGIPDQAQVLRGLFDSGVGADTEAVRTRDQGYVWFEVVKIDAAREKPLDEVKDQVTLAWQTGEAAKRLAVFAGELIKKAGGSASLETIAAELGGKVETVTVKRDATGVIGRGAVAAAFAIGRDSVADATAGNGKDRVIFKVAEITLAARPAGGPAEDSARQQIRSAYSQDLMTLYVQKRQAELGVAVNDRAFQTAIGAAPESQ